MGSCTPLSYWTHDNTSCAATGKWACVKTSKGGAGTFTTEQACIDSDGCDVTYIRNYCDTAIGKWKCIYGQPQPGKPFYTDPIDETARISCENDLADGTCKAAWNGRWSRDNNGACDWATGRYSCIKDNNGKYQGSAGSDLPPSICTTDSSCFIPYLQGSCDDSTGNYSCQAVNYWDPNDPKLYLTKTQCEQAWGCGDKWRQGKCDWTTGKWICSRCTNPNDLTGCNYESESSCVEAIGCTVPVTRYSRVEGSCVNSRWQCQENQNGNFSDLNLCQNGACDEKKEWVYDTCNTQTGNWSCHKTTPDLGVFTTEEDCQKFDGCEVEKKCSVCSRAGYNGPDKSGGDYNCDGVVNLGDYAVWLNEFIKLVYREAITGYEADGDCFRNPELNFGTSLSDYSFWRDKYLH